MVGLVGSGFTPHAITINTGEVIYMMFIFELLIAKTFVEGLGLLALTHRTQGRGKHSED